jgi:ribosome-associated translation inhibitor RaiA
VGAFDDRLRIVSEFRTDEHDHVRGILFGRLEKRLLHWQPEQVELELSVKERDSEKQRTVLECWISGVPHLAATSSERELDRALVEVRDDLHRQLDKLLTKREDSRRA